MKNLYICKVCGFISEKESPLDICPACGFKGKIFEEYKPFISAKRRKAIELHAHPATVHFPLAFIVSIFFINLLILIDVIIWKSVFEATIKGMVWLLPFAAFLAMLAGIYDGKLRFKKINTPYLQKKMILSIILIALSISLLVLQLVLDLNPKAYSLLILGYSIVFCGIGGLLGLIGGRIHDSKVRG